VEISTAVAESKATAEKAAAEAKAAAELKAVQDRAAAEAAAVEALKAAQEIADAQAKAAAELKAAQDKAAEELRIAMELKAAQEKADAELKAAAEKKALDDAKAAAALAAKKIVPKITLYSISSKLTLSAYDNAYLKKYISTLKSKAPVTCIGYYYTKNTTIAKAKVLATVQAKAVCAMIKKAKPSVITSITLYPSTKAPLAAKGAKWVAVSYRVDSFDKK
jgi:chemotaxis protein histidine kinase CheA